MLSREIYFILLKMNKMKNITKLRNIGIIAHVDAGKTTLTERILYYTGLIHKIGNVDDGNTVMDKDPQEKKRGITISSAAISTTWKFDNANYAINLIDTPGHIDFTIEVERSLRVLDGVVALFCATSGVEPQSENVWMQSEKHQIPKLCFVNKMDRAGADFFAVLSDIQSKLQTQAVAIQIPIGAEDNFIGIIDLIEFNARIWRNEGSESNYVLTEIPVELVDEAMHFRSTLLETLANHDDEFLDHYIKEESNLDAKYIHAVLRKATLSGKIQPVLCGAAYKNIGVQSLLNAIVSYLPAPDDRIYTITDEQHKPVSNDTVSALVFKVINDPYVSRLTMIRLFTGSINNGDFLKNQRTGEKVRISRLLKIHADKYFAVEHANAGDIVAISGLKDVRTGDTLCSLNESVLLDSITIPPPVISVAIEPKQTQDVKQFGMYLAKLTDEDPSLSVTVDANTGQTLLSGMGELHLEVSIEKLKLQYGLEVSQGKPKVAYKEVFTNTVRHKERFKKQNSGSGQFAQIEFMIGPSKEAESGLVFINDMKGGGVPKEFIPSVEKGFLAAMQNGVLSGYPMENLRIVLLDGEAHSVDSHAYDFEIVAQKGFKSIALECRPKLLEPIMLVEIMTVDEFTGAIISDISKRRGVVQSISDKRVHKLINAFIPLGAVFGYISDLRTIASGRASVNMKLSHYALLPEQLQMEVLANH